MDILARRSVDAEPEVYISGDSAVPSPGVCHECVLPERDSFYSIISIWGWIGYHEQS